MKTTVIYHSADFDGLFCREIARKFLPDAELIGWDFSDQPLHFSAHDGGLIYVMDLPIDRVFGWNFSAKDEPLPSVLNEKFVWIDHHKSSIETHPTTIPGYRIDGVAACRLAWQWFAEACKRRDLGVEMPTKTEFVRRSVMEPIAVRLAGEYDIWDKRDPDADKLQFGLRSMRSEFLPWCDLLNYAKCPSVYALIDTGDIIQRYQQGIDASVVTHKSFLVEFEGLKFLALNTARFNSLTFAAKDVPETGHDALLGFVWNGKTWTVSLYHAAHRTELDLSVIAVKHGGGGHRGACGFTAKQLPFL